MIGSFFGFLVALYLLYNPEFSEKYANFNILVPIFIAFSIVFILIENLCMALAFGPLQKACRQISPHLLNLFKKDRIFKLVNGWLFIFALATLALTMDILIFNTVNKNILIGIWVILFGLSFDCLQYSLRRVISYLNPFSVLDKFKEEGIKNIQDEHEIDLCDQFDALSETAIKGIQSTSPFLTNYAINGLQNLSRVFLESSKSIGHRQTDSQTSALGIQDKVTYTLSYLFQRIDFIFQKALDEKLEMVLSYLVTAMGKITLYCAKYDMTLCVHPLLYLGKFAKKSVENKFQDVGVRATCTLLEVAKEMVAEIDMTYLEIQETFLCLSGQIENIAKESLRQDKSTKILVLAKPFLDLKELFKTDKMASHQDTPVIVQDLDRIIAEFQIYDSVMRSIPPMMPQGAASQVTSGTTPDFTPPPGPI